MNKMNKISLRKGSSVRILRTNEIATIVDIELIRKGGKVHRYCRLKTDKKQDLWLDSEELGGVTEHACITFQGEKGQELIYDVEYNHCNETADIKFTGKNPENLFAHRGIHMVLATCFLDVVKKRR